MNKQRRERVNEALSILMSVLAEEQEAFDNLPESFQNGQQGEAMQEFIDSLDEAASALDGVF